MIIINKKKIFNLLLRILSWLAMLFILWLILTLLGIFSVVGIMFATKDNPSYNLEMGWMAIILLVPVAAALISLITMPFIIRMIFKRKSKKGKDIYEDEIK